ncbi:MAG: membrane integrity-associated transporter subunit PqiC [Rhodospirillales bacterium]|nr:membrane integrity-associated transporter subunit PqiC [Rhodospirillales bacterium]
MRRVSGARLRLCLLAAVFAVAGCSGLLNRESEPTNFFLLTPMAKPAAPAQAVSAGRNGPFVGVFPVRLPAYLDRASIVTKTSANELDVAQFYAWAGPLSPNITSVIGENLSVLIPTDRIVPVPANLPMQIDYEVAVEIIDFVRDADGNVQLTARWMVTRNDGRQLLAVRQSGFRATDVPFDYDAIVATMSRLLAELSRDIAAEIRNAPPARRS